jgi:DNA primase
VEGYMDVVALAQAGIPEAVATLGTATTQDHLKLLYRATSRVVFCFDGDRAGRSAAWRALEQALPEVNDGREAAFMFLPEGQDPDTLVQEIGAEAFRQRVDEAVPLTQFLINELSKRSNLSNIDGRARFAAELKPYFERMLGATLRTTLVDAIVPIVRMPRADVEAMLGGRGGGEGSDNNHQDRRMLKGPVLRLLQLVLDRPALASSIQGFGELHSLDEPGLPLLLRVVEYFHDHPEQNAAALTSTWDDPAEAKLLGDIPPPESRIFANEAAMVAEFNDGFERLRTQARRQRASELLEIARERELSAGELAELRELTASRTAQTLDRPV